jgi:hypothetical protein
MASAWFYARNGNRFGPLTSQQIRELACTGKISPEDLLWKEGMREWQKAGDARGLFPLECSPSESIALPPHTQRALPAATDTAPEARPPAITSFSRSAAQKMPSRWNWKVIGAIGVMSLVIAVGTGIERARERTKYVAIIGTDDPEAIRGFRDAEVNIKKILRLEGQFRAAAMLINTEHYNNRCKAETPGFTTGVTKAFQHYGPAIVSGKVVK